MSGGGFTSANPPILKFSFQVGDVWFCGFYPALQLNGGFWCGGLCPVTFDTEIIMCVCVQQRQADDEMVWRRQNSEHATITTCDLSFESAAKTPVSCYSRIAVET